MNDKINSDEDSYVSANEAASSSGFTRDYITRLSRQGKINAKRIEKSWYVDKRSLQEFVENQEAQKEIRRRQLIDNSRKQKDLVKVPVALPKKKLLATSVFFVALGLFGVATAYPAMEIAMGNFGTKIASDSSDSSYGKSVIKPQFVTAGNGLSLSALRTQEVAATAASTGGTTIFQKLALGLTSFFQELFNPNSGSVSIQVATSKSSAANVNATSNVTPSAQNLAALTGTNSNANTSANINVSEPSSISSSLPAPHSVSSNFIGASTPTTVATPVTTVRAPVTGTRPPTVINNIYNTYTYASSSPTTSSVASLDAVTEGELESKLNALSDSLHFQSYPSSAPSSGGAANDIALSQNIDQLTGTTLTNVRLNGVSGLQASDIPDLSGDYLALSGGTLTGALNVASATATSTFADGVDLTGGCFSINGVCITGGGGGGGSNPGGASGTIQYNNNGTLAGISNFTYSTTTGSVGIGTTTITSLTLGSALGVGYGGTGTTTIPTYGELLVGNTQGGYDLVSTSSLGIVGGGGGGGGPATWGSITGTLSNQTDLQNALNAKLSLTDWYATTTDGLKEGTDNLYFTSTRAQNAISVSGTPLTYSGGVIGINQANASQAGFLSAVDWNTFNSKLSSTSLSGGTGINYNSATGVFTSTGVTSLAAAYPLLTTGSGALTLSLGFGTTTSNTWSQLQMFNGGASTTNISVSGIGYFGTASTTNLTISSLGNALLSTNGNGSVIATTSIGTNLLTGSLGTINGTAFNAGSSITVGSASTTLLANNNTFSGTDTFNNTITGSISGNAGTVTNGVYTTTFNGLFDPRFITDLAATSSIGSITTLPNLSLPYSQITGAPTSFASSTLLGDNNTFSGKTTLTNATSSSFAITNLANSLLSVNASGSIIATTSIGTNLLTGTLGIGNGGTGSTTLSGILVGNGTSPINTLTIGSGLTLLGTTLSTSGSGITALGPIGQTQAGGTQTLATTSASFDGLTAGITIVGSSNTQTFTPTLSGTLGIAGGGTGQSSFGYGLVLGNGTNPLTNIATSSLGLLTTNVAEGSNLYFTNARAQSAISVSGTPLTYSSGVIGINQANASQSGFLASSDWTSFNNKISSTSLSATYPLAYNSSTGIFSLGFGTTTSNTWAGTQTFTNTSATNATTTNLAIIGITNAILSTNGSGSVVATTSIGTNLLTGSLGTINGTAFNAGSSITVGSASTTLLTNNNTFSGSDIFSQPLSLSSTNGTTTIASGQGFTVGSSQFVLQQGSGNVGVGTTSPFAKFSVAGNAFVSGSLTTASVQVSGVLTLPNILSCVGGQALQTDGSGNVSCGSINVSGASSGGGWTTNNTGRVSLATTTDLAVVGASTTPYAKFTVLSGSNSTTTLALIPTSGQTANIIDIYNTSGTLGSVFSAAGSLGIGTTSPGSILSVANVANFSTGTSTLYSGLNITSGCFSVNGICVGSSSASTTLLANNNTFSGTDTFNNTITGSISGNAGTVTNGVYTTTFNGLFDPRFITDLAATSSIGSITTLPNLSLPYSQITGAPTSFASSTLLGDNNTFSGKTTLTNATSSSFAITNLANSLLSVNASGSIIATTSIGTNLLTGTLGIGNGGTNATSYTSGQLLSYNGTSFVSTSTIGNNQLQNSTISGIALGSSLANLSATNGSLTFSASYNGGSAQTIGLNLANANSWTGLQSFTNASNTLTTLGTTWFSGINNAILSTNANGQVVATTSIGTNLLTGNLATVNGTTIANGGTYTITAASSTLLANSNTFSGSNSFTGNTTFGAATSSSFAITGLSSTLLKVNASGSIVPAIAGTDYAAAGSGVTSIAASYPLLTNGSTGAVTLSLGFGTTTANAWSQLQTFNGGASTTNFTASGEGFFTTASTTNLNLGTPNALLSTNANGSVVSTTVSGPLSFAGNTLSISQANGSTNGFLASGDWTTFNNKISSTSLSATYPLAYNSSTGVFSTSLATTTIQQTYGTSQIGAITFATSSASSFNGLTISHTITNTGGTFTFNAPTITGTLGNAGLTNSTISGVALGGNLSNVTFNNAGSGASSGSAYNGGSALTVSYNTIGAQAAGTYLTGLGNYATTTGLAISISTSTASFNGLTLGNTFAVSSSNIQVTPTLSGTLSASGGGTGLTNPSAAGILLGSYAGGSYQQLSTSSLGLVTSVAASGGTTGLTFSGSPITTNGTFTLGGMLGIGNGGTGASSYATGQLLAYNGTSFVSTSTIGNNQLQNASVTINGSNVALGASVTITSASSTLLTNSNTFSGNNIFSASTTFSSLININQASTSLETDTTLYLPTIQNAILSTNSSGQVVATTSIGTNLLTGNLATVNGTAIANGGTYTITAASSTVLSDNDTFSGTDVFTKALNLSSTTGTTTIASGQGFTIGTNQFVLQQGSGKVGIGTSTPSSALSVNGGGYFTSTLSAATTTISGNLTVTTNALTLEALGRPQATNDTGAYEVFYGGTGATNPMGYLGFTKAGTGGSTFFSSGELSGAMALLSEGPFQLGTDGNASPALTVDNSGNVGIGLNNPGYTLDVSGTGHVSSTLTVGNLINNGVTASTLLYANGSKQESSATVSNPLSFSAGTLSIQQANASQNGYLGSTDWTSFNNKISSTSLSATYPLAYNSSTGIFSLGFGTTTSNTWAGTQTFTNTSATNATTTNLAIIGITNAILSTNGSGSVVATTSIGTNLLTGNLATVNGTTIANGGTYTITAASSTLLANNNTFSGTNTFTNTLNLAPSSGNLTILYGGQPFITSTSSLGNANTGVGYDALQYATSTSANNNTAFGYGALTGQNFVGLTGNNNNAFGTLALTSNTTGGANIAFGNGALQSNTTGSQNIAIGVTAMNLNTTGSSNLALGGLRLTQTGSYNTALGEGSLNYATSTYDNLGVGYNALSASSSGVQITGQQNIGLGDNTLYNFTTGSGNLALGYNAGYNLTTGSNNLFLGSSFTTSNENVTTGSNNIKIGYNISLPSATLNNQLDIGNLIYGTGINGSGTGVSTGNIGIGTTTPGSLLSLNNIANFTAATSTFYSTGGINLAGGCFAINGSCLNTSGASSTLLANNNTFSGTNSFTGNTTFTNATSTNSFSTIASSTNLFSQTASLGSLTLGAGTTTAGNGVNLTSGCFAIGGTCLATASSLLSSANTWTGLQTFNAGYIDNASSTHTAQTNFTNASSTLFTATTGFFTTASTTNLTLGTPNALLSTNATGQVTATTSIGTNYLTGSLGTINGTAFTAGSSITVGSASTTLLSDNNTFSGSNLFTSLLNLTNGFVSTASSTIGNGTAAGGLTISGNATTTGNSYFSGSGKFGNTLALGTVLSCTGSQALQTDGSGNISCGAIAIGGASSGGGWNTNNIGRVSLSTSTDLVAIGATTTPYAKLAILSGSSATTTLALVPATGQTANILDIYNTSGALSSVFTAGGSLGIGTTSPSATLAVNGSGYFTGALTALGNTTLTNATTTSLAITGITNALLSTNANGTVIATTSIGTNLLTGTLGIGNGGTGSTTLSGILVGNGTSPVQTLTFSGPLSFAGNTLSISQVNGSTNGFLASGDWTTFNNKISSTSLSASYPLAYNSSTGNFSLGFGTTTTNTFSNLQTFNGGASTTNFTASGEGFFGTASTTNLTVSSAPSGFLQTNASGVVSATSTFNIANTFGILPIANGGSNASSYTTGTLLSYNGTSFVSTSTIGNNQLQNSTISGVALGGSLATLAAGNNTITFNGSYNGSTARLINLNLGNANAWTALQTFANASSSQFTASSSVYFTSLTNSLLSTNANGQVIATTSIGTNLLTGTLGTINGTGLTAGGSITITAASSTLLSDNDTFSGTDSFTNTLTVGNLINNGVTASTLLYANGSKQESSVTVSSPLSFSAGTLSIQQANGSQSGFLASGDWTTFNNKISSTSLSATYPLAYNSSTGVFSLGFGTTTNNTFSGTNTFNGQTTLGNASTSQLTNSGNTYLTSLTNSLLSTNANGQVVATTTLGTNYLSGVLGTINGTSFSVGSSITVGSASTTLLSDNNTFSGKNTFGAATSSSFAITGLANSLLSVNANGSIIATTSIGTNLLTGTLGIGNGGTGSTTLSGILVGNGTSPVQSLTFSGPLSFAGNTLTLAQANGSTNGFLASGDWTTFNNKISSTSLSASYPLAYNSSTGVFSLGFGTTTANTYSALQVFNAGASTSALTLGTGAGFLQTNAAGVVSATSSIPLSSTFGTLAINQGGTNATSYTSGQLLSYNGTSFVSTSTIGNNQLQNSTISGIALGGNLANLTAGSGLSGTSYNGGTAQSFSLNLANANSWTGLQSFTNASNTLTTLGTTWFSGINSAILSTNANRTSRRLDFHRIQLPHRRPRHDQRRLALARLLHHRRLHHAAW